MKYLKECNLFVCIVFGKIRLIKVDINGLPEFYAGDFTYLNTDYDLDSFIISEVSKALNLTEKEVLEKLDRNVF